MSFYHSKQRIHLDEKYDCDSKNDTLTIRLKEKDIPPDDKTFSDKNKEKLMVRFKEKDISFNKKAIEDKKKENLSYYRSKTLITPDDKLSKPSKAKTSLGFDNKEPAITTLDSTFLTAEKSKSSKEKADCGVRKEETKLTTHNDKIKLPSKNVVRGHSKKETILLESKKIVLSKEKTDHGLKIAEAATTSFLKDGKGDQPNEKPALSYKNEGIIITPLLSKIKGEQTYEKASYSFKKDKEVELTDEKALGGYKGEITIFKTIAIGERTISINEKAVGGFREEETIVQTLVEGEKPVLTNVVVDVYKDEETNFKTPLNAERTVLFNQKVADAHNEAEINIQPLLRDRKSTSTNLAVGDYKDEETNLKTHLSVERTVFFNEKEADDHNKVEIIIQTFVRDGKSALTNLAAGGYKDEKKLWWGVDGVCGCVCKQHIFKVLDSSF